MTRVYVSLDLETTGLSPEQDRIIEIGAVRFKGQRIFDEFHTLVNPNCAIPYQIQQLTGITNEDVAKAPRFEAIRAKLKRFVGDSPIIGHNIGFDLNFLRKQGLFKQQASIDTFELASILMPHAGRYSLSALADLLNIKQPPTHRALDDAQVTQQLFEALQDQARLMDAKILTEVAQIGARSHWSLTPVFQDLSRERSSVAFGTLGQQLSAQGQLDSLKSNLPEHPPLKPLDPPQPLDGDELAAILAAGGVFNQIFKHFEYRPQQVTMLRALVAAMNEAHHLMVEAGTGTGKSMAYLIPAIYWALKNQTRVVISTNTINLQDQLLQKDLPDLQKTLKLDFRATALKGRSNYLCPKRLTQLQRKPNHTPAELRLLAKITIWLPNTLTGDRQELFMPDYAEQDLWSQVNSHPEICRAELCRPDTCYFARARQVAESAHLIVVNHALLLADISVNNRAIPEYQYLIIDEAHHLEGSVTHQLSFSANRRSIEQLFQDLSQANTNPFALIEHQTKKGGLAQLISTVTNLHQTSRQVIQKASQAWYYLFQVLDDYIVQAFGKNRNQYDRKLRISDKVRYHPAWSNIELAWDNANLVLADVIAYVNQAHKLWDGIDAYAVEDWDQIMLSLSHYRTQLDEIKHNVQMILGEPDDKTITWLEQKIESKDISLHAAPLHVGSLVRQHLFDSKSSVTMTSATLRTDNSFEYVKERLSAWDVKDIALGSPFDYVKNTLVYVPTNMPEPNDYNFQRLFEQTLVDLAKATKGRMLVLFTSYNHLRTTSRNLYKPLSEHKIMLYQQGAGSGRRQLLENFKNTEKAILMGTRSFWEGIDVPGESLSCVVIAKIPFAVPSDPIYQARSETFDNAFTQYAIPEAILHFRQGFGRLIRTRLDRGVVVIMDRRVLSKNYGRSFLDSLPEVTLRQGLTNDLPYLAETWIDGKALG